MRRIFLRNSGWCAVAIATIMLVSGCESSVGPRLDTRTGSADAPVSTKALTLSVGEERKLSVTNPATQVVWESDNPAVASVSAIGVLSARAAGGARVIAHKPAAAETTLVTVRNTAASIQLLSDTFAIGIGATTQLAVQVLTASGATVDDPEIGLRLRWSSTSAAVASVDSRGVVSANAIGQATIIVAIDGKADSTTINVVDALISDLVINVPAEFGLAAGATYPLHAVARDAAGHELANRSFVWSTSNAGVASVSQSGVVTGVSSGSAEIAVSSEGHTASVRVLISSAVVAHVVVSFSAGTIGVGQTAQAVAIAQDANGIRLNGLAIGWSSGSSSVAIVSNQGVIQGVGAGSVKITATVGGVAGSAPIGVVGAPSTSEGNVATVGVSVTPSSLSVGQTAQAVATPLDSAGRVVTGQAVTWSAPDSGIGTVSSAGLVTAVSAGSATVRATINGIVGQASLNVSVPNVITAPAPSSGTLAADFEDGTFGPLYNPWGTDIDVPGDPTGGGHGKVARYHYATNGTTQFDDNKALLPQSTAVARGLGQEVWFQGDFYIDPAARMDASGSAMVQRKLFRFGSDGISFRHPVETELTAFGPQLALVFQPEQAFTQALGTGALYYISTPGSTVTAGAWHRIKMYQKINSSFGVSDGILRLWYDGVLILDRSDLRWSDPTWTDNPSSYVWNSWGVGYQVNGNLAIDETRYWDNVIFSQAPILP